VLCNVSLDPWHISSMAAAALVSPHRTI
jgi:hypothetical protein